MLKYYKYAALLTGISLVSTYGIINVRYWYNWFYFAIKTKTNTSNSTSGDNKNLELSSTCHSNYCVTLTDTGWFGHMNMSSYPRYSEFSRIQWALERNVISQLFENNYTFQITSMTCRFRRELNIFDQFIVETIPVYWDKCKVIFEKNFINKKNGFLHCTMYSQGCIVDTIKHKKVQFESNTSTDDGTKREGLYKFDWYNNITN